MPLQQRLIEPVHVCRNTLPLDDNGTLSVDVPNELECVTNGTLANIIRQLSSLSKQAEDIFGSLVRESTSIAARTNSLQGRVDRLAIKVTQLDSNVEEVSLQDIHMRKAFKSSVVYDQQVVSRESIPAAIKEIYLMCDKPPPLDKLNPYREDGKDGLKFYTDANYFFDLWKQEMLKDTERLAHDKGRKVSSSRLYARVSVTLAHVKEGTEPNQPRQERKRHKKVRQPHNTREKYRMMATKDEFLDKTANYPHLPYGVTPRPNSHMGDMVDNHANGYPVRPSSLELQSAYGSGQESGYLSSPTHHYPPPPPAYIEHPQSPSHGYPPPPYTVATPDQHGGGSSMGTPTRQLNRVATMVRPTQPPPAPPISSNSSSGTSTPTVSANGTPSSGAGRYYRGSSHSRDNLPPPPPPPEGTIVNGGIGQSQFIISNEAAQKANRGPNGSIPHTPTHAIQQGGSRHGTPTHHPHVVNNHSTSILIQHNREQTPPPTVNVTVNQTQPTPENLDLPPPPPTPDKETAPSRPESQLPPSPPPPPPPANVAPPNGVLPPPPPPMPLPNQLPNGPIVTNGGTSAASEGRANELASLSSESASTSSSLSKGSENQESKGKGTTDARSDLLAAIREGIKLRRVEDIKQKEVEKAAPLHDVASILARRIAMEFSDSDSASYSDVDSDAWDDETEC